MSQNLNQNQRRFPRIFLQEAGLESGQQKVRTVPALVGAKASWADGEPIDVIDLSYIGAALRRPRHSTPVVGAQVRLQFLFAGQDTRVESIEAKIVRVSEQLVAVQFLELSATARLALERFLEAKIIGLHMRPIDAKFFAKSVSGAGEFTHWFHGPNNANVFLWYESLTCMKAVVELGDDFLSWNQGRFFTGVSRQYLENESDDYLQPLLDGQFETESVAHLGVDGTGAKQGLTPLMMRVLNMLSQIEDRDKILQPLIRAIAARQGAK